MYTYIYVVLILMHAKRSIFEMKGFAFRAINRGVRPSTSARVRPLIDYWHVLIDSRKGFMFFTEYWAIHIFNSRISSLEYSGGFFYYTVLLLRYATVYALNLRRLDILGFYFLPWDNDDYWLSDRIVWSLWEQNANFTRLNGEHKQIICVFYSFILKQVNVLRWIFK